MLLGVDIGGTFTDFVYHDGNSLRIHKVLSTPDAPERAIFEGIKAMGIAFENLRVIHGTTVATNAILEGKGAKTVYITNHGLKDVLTIGRQARRELYNLQPQTVEPPVADGYCLETGGRLGADGSIIEDLTEDDIDTLLTKVKTLDVQAAAINLLFSYLDDRFECMIEEALSDDLYISRSSKILPEYREYERGITTWLNAYVGPLVKGYLHRLENQLIPASLSVMRSSGNTCSVNQAGDEAVHLLLSGPAGGLSGAQYVANAADHNRLLTLDMGGTSTDVALVDGSINLTGKGHIDRYPIGIPMVDMHTIGAGGGSIASVDAGGALQVGPESAGAQPGPACYAHGGKLPTVTDANLVLGYLPRTALLGGNMPLDFDRAMNAVESLMMQLRLDSIEAVAEGIIRVANEHMVQALRVISVQRGIDPRELVLVAFGGAGGMHICALANALQIKQAMAPVQAGALSALGMLVAPPGRQLSRTIACLLEDYTDVQINALIDELAIQGKASMSNEGIDPEQLKLEPSLDLCYHGQSFTLNIPWQGIGKTESAFHSQHKTQFGHDLDTSLELINIRLGVTANPAEIKLPKQSNVASSQCDYGHVYKVNDPVAIWPRTGLSSNQVINGPVIITDEISTVYVAPDWQCQLDNVGNLLLSTGN